MTSKHEEEEDYSDNPSESCAYSEGCDDGYEQAIKNIEDYKNPYPKDIFCWDNEEKLDFNRGRFNQHCWEIVENVRKDILKELREDEE